MSANKKFMFLITPPPPSGNAKERVINIHFLPTASINNYEERLWELVK